MGQLSGKVAIITGGGQGVGLGVAHAFAREGANIVLTGRTASKLQAAAEDLESRHGIKVLCVAGNVMERKHAEETVAAVLAKFGRVDVLVNNAQTTTINVPILELKDDDLESTMRSGLYGSLYFMQNVAPAMHKQGGGKIINFASRRGISGMAGAAAYAATKEGIRALTRVAAREWGRMNIQVNCISPAAKSPPSDKLFAENPAIAEKILGEMALGRLGDAERDIGQVAVFLACSMSDFITGQTLNADGGIVMF